MDGYERRGNVTRSEPIEAKKDATDRATGSSLCSLQHWEARGEVFIAVQLLCWLSTFITYRNLISKRNLSKHIFWFSKGIIYCFSQQDWAYILCLLVGLAHYFFCQQAWLKYIVSLSVSGPMYCVCQ